MESSVTRVKGHNSRMRLKTKISIINILIYNLKRGSLFLKSRDYFRI